MDGRTVPHAMRVETFLAEGGLSLSSLSQMLRQDISSSKPGKGSPDMVRKNGERFSGVNSSFFNILTQYVGRFGPDWTDTLFSPLSVDTHTERFRQFKISGLKIDDFLHSGAGVKHKSQEGIVPPTIQCRTVNGLENCLDLFKFEILYGPHGHTLER